MQQLSKYLSAPAEESVEACRRSLKYLKGTQKLGLEFRRSGKNAADWENAHEAYAHVISCISACADADFANGKGGRAGLTGLCLLSDECVYGWATSRQGLAAQSTAEAVYTALFDVSKRIGAVGSV